MAADLNHRQSDCGGQRTVIAYSLIQTCRLNEVDLQALLADVLTRIAAPCQPGRRPVAVELVRNSARHHRLIEPRCGLQRMPVFERSWTAA